jgi:hypothetical protein
MHQNFAIQFALWIYGRHVHITHKDTLQRFIHINLELSCITQNFYESYYNSYGIMASFSRPHGAAGGGGPDLAQPSPMAADGWGDEGPNLARRPPVAADGWADGGPDLGLELFLIFSLFFGLGSLWI